MRLAFCARAARIGRHTPANEEEEMGLMDKAKSMAERTATKTREGVEDMKTKRELGETFDSLGKLTFELVESGEISHEKITPLVEKIKSLKAALEA
jgi:hypothetical protein